jgi:hypothetical protein
LAVINAVGDLPGKAAAFEASAATKDPASAAALQLNSRAHHHRKSPRGVHTFAQHARGLPGKATALEAGPRG